MAVYLSPGLYPREIDLSVLPTAVGPLRPAFIGTAQKGPLNQAVYISSAQQAIETFGDPFPSSYLMYAVLSYLEEGNQCYIMRIGVECQTGQPTELSSICIDTSGARGAGWGRIPLFTGIDFGRINLREVSVDSPLTFHAASTNNIDFNDADLSSTNGATSATLSVTGTYTGDVDDSFLMVITGAPTVSAADQVDGATFQIIRNSDGEIVAEGTLSDGDFNGTSQLIDLDNGLFVQVVVSDGTLDINDTFTFEAHPDNRKFSISVEGGSATEYTMPSATYTTAATFATAFNALLTGEDYLMIAYTLDDDTVIPQLRTDTAGDRVQIMGTSGWALEVGSQQYAWDIPRSYLLGVDDSPFDITASNNRVKINVVGDASTEQIEFNVPTGLAQSATALADAINVAGTVSGESFMESFMLTAPGGTEHVVIVASSDHQYDMVHMLASYSNIKTLRFAEELNIPFPYKRAYRGFSDNRLVLPQSGSITASTPLSCETDPFSSDCAADTAYFENIVGWLVAVTPGTWIDGYTATIEVFTDSSLVIGSYKVIIKDSNGGTVEAIENVTFDKSDDRYIGNVINPGSKYGGTNGNAFVNWDERPAYLDNDVSDTSTYAVRYPSQFVTKAFNGQANGIPSDPAYSSELDAAVIGNAATSTGLYAFQNPETIDINLLITPGFSTGAVIGTALQMCESRGDVLYLVDPPFGLRPQQVVDWHNGMLLSDLRTAINSSYGALYWGWLRIFDQFSANEIWIPPSGYVAGVFSRTARDTEQWFAPAGLRRGRLLTALDVEYSPAQGERDLLYGSGNAVNPIVKFPQDGIVIWGQRTLQRTQSALDRVAVRMLLIFIKKNLIRLLRNFIFEPNDRILWKQVLATINPFLADIQSRRGLEAFNVIVDETNNTPERIDRNELWVSVFLKPTRTVEFIVLNLITLRTGASFSAEEVLAAGGIAAAATAT